MPKSGSCRMASAEPYRAVVRNRIGVSMNNSNVVRIEAAPTATEEVR